MESFHTESPIDGRVLFSRNYATEQELEQVLERAEKGSKDWKVVSLEDRVSILRLFVDAVVAQKNVLAKFDSTCHHTVR